MNQPRAILKVMNSDYAQPPLRGTVGPSSASPASRGTRAAARLGPGSVSAPAQPIAPARRSFSLSPVTPLNIGSCARCYRLIPLLQPFAFNLQPFLPPLRNPELPSPNPELPSPNPELSAPKAGISAPTPASALPSMDALNTFIPSKICDADLHPRLDRVWILDDFCSPGMRSRAKRGKAHLAQLMETFLSPPNARPSLQICNSRERFRSCWSGLFLQNV